VTTTAGTPEITPALLSLLRAVSRGAHADTIRPALHTLPFTVKGALAGGASLLDLPEVATWATTPAAEAVPTKPWESLLPLALDAFAATGAGLQVAFPHLGETIWLTGSTYTAHRLAVEGSAWRRLVKGLGWMEAEARRGGLPVAERTGAGSSRCSAGKSSAGCRRPRARAADARGCAR
jgi:hypothetical protein